MEAHVTGLLITMVSSLVIAIMSIMIIHKMIDATLHPVQGFTALAVALILLFSCVTGSHLVAGIILVSVLGLAAVYPFASSQIEKIQHQEIDSDVLAKAYQSVGERPDNAAAKLALAQALYHHGFSAHAIILADSTIAGFSTIMDEVSNRSVRDIFRKEEIALARWKQEARPTPDIRCPRCGTVNPPIALVCVQCQSPYPLDLARMAGSNTRFTGRIVMTWALLAGLIAVAAQASDRLSGGALWLFLLVVFGLVGGLIAFLFRDRSPLDFAKKAG